ncbi:MAG TPA: beta-CASP ribonuclease aCPSF1 [Candidatus Thermoplasmatota archaeon]
MTVEDILQAIGAKIRETLPPSVDVTGVEFEGALLVIYTKHPEKFADLGEFIRRFAKQFQRRIIVRPDPSALKPIEEAEERVRSIIPDDAEISNIYWEPDTGEVTIEVGKPGLAIGAGGAVLNELRRAIGWTPKIQRTPPLPSKTVTEVRSYIRQMAEERKEFLRLVGRRLHRELLPDVKPWVRFSALGAFREVGRSCSMLQTQDSKILIDCGVKFSQDDPETPFIHTGEVLPFSSIDAVVVTHAHLDHMGLVPLLYRLGFDGPIYCTAPTRDLMTLLQVDYLKVAAAQGARPPYSSDHIRECIKKTITLNFEETTDITPDVRLTLYNAGHILGSSIAHFNIGNGAYNVAWTGDLKYERTWLFNPAQNRFPRLEAMIMEATYGGGQDFQPTLKAANDGVREIVQRVMKKNGKVIFPVFAVGRSQEMMIVLEYLMRTEQIPKVPVYLDGMIFEATAIHTAYPEYLNNQLRTQIFQEGNNPFLSPIFVRVESYDQRKQIVDSTDPCIVLATSGMMTGGPVMEYLKAWAPDERNTLVFCGFQADGTLGRKIQRGQRELPVSESPRPGDTKSIRIAMDIETVDGFSGHSDRRQLMNFIANMDPRPTRIFLGHGEESKCVDLATALTRKFGIESRAMKNLESVRFK